MTNSGKADEAVGSSAFPPSAGPIPNFRSAPNSGDDGTEDQDDGDLGSGVNEEGLDEDDLDTDCVSTPSPVLFPTAGPVQRSRTRRSRAAS